MRPSGSPEKSDAAIQASLGFVFTEFSRFSEDREIQE
jgi:hypothetical protein